VLRLVLVLLCVLPLAAFAAPKKKKPKRKAKAPVTATMQAEVARALDAAEAKVGGCVVEQAGAGEWKRVVRVKVTLNGVGQVMGSTLAVEPQDAAADAMRPCIDGALREVSYPKTGAPLVNAEREWTFQMQAQAP